MNGFFSNTARISLIEFSHEKRADGVVFIPELGEIGLLCHFTNFSRPKDVMLMAMAIMSGAKTNALIDLKLGSHVA
jgi:hypothetical protein